MGIYSKHKIEILSKILEVPYRKVPIETNKILKINQETIRKLIKDDQSLIFEIKEEHLSGYIKKETNKMKFHGLPEFKIGDYKLNLELVKSDNITRKYNNAYDITYVNVKNGVLRLVIKPDLLESFLKLGTITLKHSNGTASKVDIKISNNGKIQTSPLASFLIAETFLNHKEHHNFTNHKDSNLKTNLYLKGNFNIYRDNNILNMMSDYHTSRHGNFYGKAKVKRKPYFLVKLVETHPDKVDMKKIGQNNDKKLDNYNVPQNYYQGIVGFKDEIKNNDSIYDTHKFIQLASLKDISWVDINGEKFIPINYSQSYIEEKKERGAEFEEKIFDDQFILRPHDEGLSLVVMKHDHTKDIWVREIIPLKDQSKTIIYLDEKSQIWKSTETDIWGSVDKKTADVFTGINNNFSVECLYTERYSYATSRGLEKFKSAPMEDRCVPLVNYIPETKRERKIWYNSDKIFIQQSTFGLEAEAMAKIVEIDPKTKKIVKVYDMNNLAGSPFKVAGKDFREGKIAIVLGPNRARIDVSPELYSSPTHSETHGIFAGGYRTNDKNHSLAFNY